MLNIGYKIQTLKIKRHVQGMSKISFLFKVVSIETFRIRNSQEGNEISKAMAEKQLRICVMYFEEPTSTVQPVTRFLDMVEVETVTAVGLYNAIKSSFEDKNIPIKNIIGYSLETTNVVFGEHQSVVSLLKKDVSFDGEM